MILFFPVTGFNLTFFSLIIGCFVARISRLKYVDPGSLLARFDTFVYLAIICYKYSKSDDK